MAQVNDPNNLYTRLRISNPLNFNQPTHQELFNRQFQENTPLQKELETRLDSVYRLSPNSEADSNIVDSAAVFMDLFDMDHEQALGLARTTFSAGLTNEARERMGFGQALGQTALNTFNQFSAGTNMAFYMIGGNDEHKAKALEKQSKIVNLWEDYGFLGNTVLSSIQPLGSSLRYMGTTALLRGGSALLARAIGVSHPILATATFIAGTGLSFLANISITGLSQAGSDFLEYSQMADKNGTKLDLDSPEAKTLFWTSALVHGTIESIGSELLPGVRYLNKTIDSVARNAILKESWKQVLLRVALDTPVGIIGEGFEEFLAVYNTALTENSLKYLANKEGATFDYTTGREMVTEGWKAFTDGAVSMIIPSILTGALGGGIYNARTSAAARANFNKTEGSISIDRRYVEDVPKPTGPKEGDVQKPAAEREKLDPVKLVDVGGTTPKLVALNAAEREKLGEAAARNAEAVEAIIVEQEPLSVEDRQSLVNRAALATGGKLSGERIVYETKDDLEMAKILLDPVSTQGDTVTFRDEDGELVSLDLTLAEEGMDITEADISYYEDPEAPHSLARMTQDKALEYQERKLIKDAIGNVVEHTGGRISNTDLEANVDAVKMVAETLNIPTDELLGKGVAFRLVDKVYDATGSEVSARGSIESNISIEGKKQYTINISKTADATTILHELGHTLRGLATDEQIRDFRLFYGKGKEAAFIGDINKVGEKFYVGEQAFDTLEQAQKLVEANEEAFANDFVAYLRTGQAPTADLKNIFARMKAVLNRFLVEFGYRLDPEVRQAFDNLLRRESQGLPYMGTIPADAEGNVLFQQSPPVGSDEFKRIFGDSKVVTKSGEPILVYHGSPSLFKSFNAVQLSDSGYLGAGFYFSSLKGVAETYASRTNSGYIYNAYLVMNNPLMWNEEWNGKWDEIAKNILNKYPNVNKGSDEYGTLLAMELREMGYDGVLDMKGDVVNEAVVFDDKQVLLNGIEKYNLNNTLFQLAPPTDSEAFKAWFGDSKVVDENGNPLVVYHATDNIFTVFDPNRLGEVTEPNQTEEDSPFIKLAQLGFWASKDSINKRTGQSISMPLYFKIEYPLYTTLDDLYSMSSEFEDGDSFQRYLSRSYDGIILKDTEFNTTSYVAFSPTQIKSVNNRGTWDAESPNILFQQAPPVDSDAFKAWFMDSKALDKNGNPLVVYHGTPSKVPIEVFDESEDGYWFTDSNKLAEQFTHRRDLWTSRDFGHVEAVYLRLLNPLDIDAAGSTWDNIANTPLQGNGEWKPKAFGNLPNNAVSASDVVSYAKANGYDGIVFHDLRDSVNSYIYGNVKSTNYVVFDREQIKSVNNLGTWDTKSINILFQKVPPVGSEEYKQLFDESKAVDKQGRPLTLYHGSTFTGILEFDNTGIYKAHGGEPGYVYATDDYDTANEFSYEQLPGKSNLTYIQGARGQVYPVHMSIKHPLDFRNLTSNDFENMKDAAVKYSPNTKTLPSVFDDAKAGGEYAQAYLRQTARDLVEHLSEYGYDGLISEMRNGGPLEYAVVSSGQVRSVDNMVLPESSPWRLFQLSSVESVVTVRDNAPKVVRVYEVSTQPEDMHRLFGDDHPANLEITDLLKAREVNVNTTRLNDWQQIYARAMESGGKGGEYLKFADMRKVNKDGKLMDVPVIALSKGCQRAQTTVERVANGILPSETNIEACYGGTCWVNRQFNSKFGTFENMEVRDLVMPTPKNIDRWFDKPSIRQFLTTGAFIREGQMGCSSHAFPILDGYGVSLAETWLKNIKNNGIKQKTIFITAAYAPVTKESYERLLPYKELFEIHVSISGWFHKNELMLRLAEFKVIREVGLPVSFRIVTNKDNIADLKMPNQEWLNEQLSQLNIRQDEVLETPYHDDGIKKGQKRSDPTGDYKFICCETGKCATCGAKCMSKIEHSSPEMTSYERIFVNKESPAVSTGLRPSGTSPIPEIQPSGNLDSILSDAKSQINSYPNYLFQLSPEAKQQLLEERKKDVQDAVENHFWVSSRILEEYLDEEWAQKEMATREYLNQFPWMLEEARQFATPDEYLQFIETMSEEAIEKGEQYKMTPEDADWHRKIFAYARIQSPQDLDKQFIDNYTKDKKSIAQLARAIKTYQDIGNRKVLRNTKLKEKSRIVVWKWGTFKGVSPYVKNFTENSSDEDFERAKKLIQENPRAYRKALRIVSDAEERVMAFKTHSSTSSYGYSREAYYDELDDEMLAALDEPLLLSEMTDREAAEYLRTTGNKQERFNAREKLATHMGVYAMELQADAEVKRLGEVKDSEIKKLQKQRERLANELKETGEQFKKARKDLRSTESALEKERARSWELVEKLDEKSKQASKVNQLEKDLADRRARVKELRTQLTEKSREARRLNRQVTAYENREEARKTREKIERLMKVAYVAIKVSPSMDASYHPVFGWVQERLGLTSEYSKPDAPWKKKVDMLEDYLPRDVLDMLSAGIQIDQWSVEALQALVDGMRMLQRQARIEGAYRADQTRMRRDRIALEYDRQTYGYTPVETDQSIESVMGEIRDRLDNRKQNFYNGSEGKLAKMAHVFRQSLAHIWSFSEWLDGQKENGIMFKTFARTVWEYYQEEFRNVQRRLSAFDDVRKSMGYNQERLAKKVFTYTTPGGNEVTLNLEQAITAYIYSLNEKGLKKLIHAGGNGMSHAVLADMYQVLSEDDKQFAQAMIDAAGGDAEYMRLAEVFYRVYNHDLSREQNYFRFRAAGVEMENDIDLAKGIRKERFSFVEKGFGEDRTEAIYPLNLNGLKNLTKTIEEQEHLIHFGEWVRDANYLLGQKGSLGHEVRVTYGDTSLKTLQTFVKRIAGAQDVISSFESMVNNLITQVSSSLISANLSSMMKQAASMSYILMGDISLSHAVRVMFGWSPTPEIRNWVHAYEVMCELDPSMKERTFDIEVKRSRNLEYTNKASRALAKIRDTGIKYTTQLGDSVITVKMWWGAYLTALDKFANMEKEGRMREAVFYASRFIAETQSSSNPMDLAEIQTSRHTWPRLISAFKRDAFKRWNLAFYKLPQAVRNRQWAKAGGIITSQLLGLLILAGVRGLFIKKDDDDDEKYRKFLMKNLTAQLFEEAIPYAGEGIASGILGFGGGDLLELDDVSGRWLGEFFDGDKDWEAFWKRSWELVITSLSTVGVPSLAVERTIKSIDEMNFWRMIGGYWYKLGEDD